MTVAARFEAFVRGVYGRAPYPWQVRLAVKVVESGWPSLLDLPTGVGKTSAFDVALFALAEVPERSPRRVFLVVDRRLVVDQAAAHARHLKERLSAGAAPEVAERLRALSGGPEPFAVTQLRGGMPREEAWTRRPDLPLLGSSTVDQVGSRLLFRGYGVSERMAPVHAGLLGCDTLFLLDEVHLANPFAETLAGVARINRSSRVLRPLVAVRMSATPATTAPDAFRLDDADRADPRLAARLGAAKPARLRAVRVAGDEARRREMFAQALAEEACAGLAAGAQVVGVVVNRVATARAVHRLLATQMPRADVALLTGRMRPLDRELQLRNLDVLGRAGGDRPRSERPCPRPLVIVATQCIEAGADLDLDSLVTECASLDALRQRFGRLNRRGEHGSAAAAILARSDQVDPEQPDPVYGASLARTWLWLDGQGSPIDFGVLGQPQPTADEASRLLAPSAHAPVLLPTHVEAWAQTAPRPDPDPEVALWLHGPERGQAEVHVVWRADVFEADLGALTSGSMEAATARERLLSLLTACPPHPLEALTLPLHAVRSWLSGQAEDGFVSDQLGTQDGSADLGERAAADGRGRTAIRWDGEGVEAAEAADLRPGDTLVVPAARGGIEAWGWAPEAVAPVADLGDVAQWIGRARALLRVEAGPVRGWGLPESVAVAAAAVGQVAATDEAEGDADGGSMSAASRALAWASLLTGVESAGHPEAWREARARLLAGRGPRVLELPGGAVVLHARRDPGEAATTEGEEGTFLGRSVTLARHSGDVERWARAFARALALPQGLAEDVARAAWLHDVGKADPRFQRLLAGGSEVRQALLDEPLAKASEGRLDRRGRLEARRRSGYPESCRHELLSVAMVERTEGALAGAHDPELVLHLVGSHHGWCRPFPPALDDPEDRVVQLRHGQTTLQASTRHRLARLDSGVSERFWALCERYGPWGLAWLEALLRLADHRASEEEGA